MRIHPTKWTGSPEVKFTFDFIWVMISTLKISFNLKSLSMK
jgi:hypothetical protein